MDLDDPTSEPYEHRVYGDNNASTWCVVDEEDYSWAVRWCWSINRPHPNRNGKKQYYRRSRSQGGLYIKPIYLHVEIMKRTGKQRPTAEHTLVDHKDGNEWNCRRSNLRWVTPVGNRKNTKRKAK